MEIESTLMESEMEIESQDGMESRLRRLERSDINWIGVNQSNGADRHDLVGVCE